MKHTHHLTKILVALAWAFALTGLFQPGPDVALAQFDNINTTIDSAPTNPSYGAVTFTFSHNYPDPNYEGFSCQLDAGGWGYCTSPQVYYLAPGEHTFQVLASAACLGCTVSTDSTPASYTWVVGTVAPAAESIVSAGYQHTCTLTPSGAVVCWGDNQWGQAGTQIGPYTQVSAGGFHTCALTPSGAVECWGAGETDTGSWPDYGQAIDHAGPYTQVSAGETHTCALMENGDIDCWGDNSEGQAGTHTGPYTQVSAGYQHTCAVKGNGDVDCWGRNDESQAGSHTGPYLQVSAGDYHTCALAPVGWVDCWGDNTNEQAGTHAGPYTQISARAIFTCALKPDGGIECWGWGPTVSNAGPYTGISAGNFHLCAALANGDINCWGSNTMGQAEDYIDQRPETSIDSIPGDLVNTASASFSFSSDDPDATFECALDGIDFAACTNPQEYTGLVEGSHTLQARAKNTLGYIDLSPSSYTWRIDLTLPETTIVQAIPFYDGVRHQKFNFSSSEPGSTFQCQLDGDEWAACTSPRTYDDLAVGAHTFQVWAMDPAGNEDLTPASHEWTIDTIPPETTFDSTPGDPSYGGPTFTFSSSDDFSTFVCQVDANGWTACSSPAVYNLLPGPHTFLVQATDPFGNQDDSPASYAWTIGTVNPAPADLIASGAAHSCALKPDGSVDCWTTGENLWGEAEDKPGPYTQLGAGFEHTCGLTPSGAIECWGAGKSNYTSPPMAGQSVDHVGPYLQVGVGAYHTCGLTASGDIECWGYNDPRGGTRPGFQAGPYSQISVGFWNTCALKQDGSFECWGLGGTPAGQSGPYSQVAAGDHVCGLKPDGSADCWNVISHVQYVRAGPYIQINSGSHHICGLTPAGGADCWGDNEQGQAGYHPGPYIWVDGGNTHTCALTMTGDVDCWGANLQGQSGYHTGPYGSTEWRTDQTITFDTIANKTFGDAPFAVSASASSGLPITFSASGNCTISSDTVTITGAGYCTIIASQAGDDAYRPAADVPQPFTINPRPIQVTADAQTKSLGEGDPALTYRISGGSLVTGDSFTGALTRDPGETAGTYQIRRGTLGLGNNYSLTYIGANLTIRKGQTTTTLLAPASAIPGEMVTLTARVTAVAPNTGIPSGAVVFLDGDTLLEENVQLSNGEAQFTTDDLAPGVHPLRALYAGDASWEGSAPGLATLTVSKLEAEVTLAGLSQIYDGTPKSVTVTTNPEELTVNVTYAGSLMPPTDAGEYAVVVTVDDPQYQGTASGTLVISPATATVTLSNLEQTYDGRSKRAMVTTEPAGLAVNITYEGSATPPTNAGSYALVATVNESNYQGSVSGTLTIGKATATVTLSDLEQTYDGQRKPATATTDPAGLTVGVTYAGSLMPPTNAGEYAVVATINDANYQGMGSDTLVIEKAAVTVSALNASKTYGDSNPTFTATAIGEVEGGAAINYSLSTSAGMCSNVGSYPITVDLGVNPNYNITTTDATLTITVKAASVAAVDRSKTYGDDNPALTATVTGEVTTCDAVNYSLATTARQLSDVDTYPITVTLGSNPNYSVTKSDGTLTIDPKDASVTANNKSKIYGDDNPALTATVVGAVAGGDRINYSLSTSAVKLSGVGDYPIAVTLSDNPNYNVNANDGTLTINKKDASVTAVNKSKMYGDDNPVPTATVVGAVAGGDPINYSLSTSANNCSNIGNYSIVATLGDNPNYNVTVTDGTLTINKKDASVAAEDKTKTYGQDNPALTATEVGEVASCDALNYSLSTSAVKLSGVGDYSIVVTLDSNPNYNVTVTDATLTVEPAPLTVTADDQTANYSEPNPDELTFTYEGWIEGEGPTEPYLTTAPTCSTTRQLLSPAGTYPITCSGGVAPNYEFTYKGGTFTVTKESTVIVYTGDTQVTTSKAGAKATVTLAATLEEKQDGSLGNELNGQQVLFQVYSFSDNTYTTPLASCTATIGHVADGMGYGSCTVSLGAADPYQVEISLVNNNHYAAEVETVVVLVNDPGTGMTVGAGWLIDPNTDSRVNFGFLAKFLKNGRVQGNSLFVYRVTTDLSTLIPGAPAGERAYNWIIKSNAMQGLNIYNCPTGAKTGCKATITGKSTIQAVDRLTGILYSVGGNYQFQVDVTDNREPGSRTGTVPDQYAIRVWSISGTYYELGNTYDANGKLLAPLAITGGNIQVKAK